MAGRFVTFEGIEGSGKSTQLSRLAERLETCATVPLVTREPGGTPLGERLREALLTRRGDPLDPLTEALLMAADRQEHVEQLIRPALAAGRIVLCDRYADSTLAYQGGGSGVDREILAWLNRLATGGLVPDRTFLFDLPVETALERLASRTKSSGSAPDRFEAERREFHERVRQSYLELAQAEPQRFVVLDAARDPGAVFQDLLAAFHG